MISKVVWAKNGFVHRYRSKYIRVGSFRKLFRHNISMNNFEKSRSKCVVNSVQALHTGLLWPSKIMFGQHKTPQ